MDEQTKTEKWIGKLKDEQVNGESMRLMKQARLELGIGLGLELRLVLSFNWSHCLPIYLSVFQFGRQAGRQAGRQICT